MIRRRPLAVAGAGAIVAIGSIALAACGVSGAGTSDQPQALVAPMPTVAGVGALPATAAMVAETDPPVVVTRPTIPTGEVAELVGEIAQGNRILMLGDSILASTATRYSGYMCDALVPLGWSVAVEAEPSRSIDFGNRILDKRLKPERGTDFDWDAAVVFLGSNYGSDQERYEEELVFILTRLAPRPVLLFTVTEYRPAWAEVNVVVRKLADEFDNVTVVDWQQFATTPGVLSSDRLHPTDDGRQALVDLTAAALGPAGTAGSESASEGECLKSQFTDDSAVGRGGTGNPASNPNGGSGSGSGTGTKPAATTTTVKPTGTTLPGTTLPGGGTTVPPTTSPGTTSPPTTLPPTTTPVTTVPPTSAPAVTTPPTALPPL